MDLSLGEKEGSDQGQGSAYQSALTDTNSLKGMKIQSQQPFLTVGTKYHGQNIA